MRAQPKRPLFLEELEPDEPEGEFDDELDPNLTERTEPEDADGVHDGAG